LILACPPQEFATLGDCDLLLGEYVARKYHIIFLLSPSLKYKMDSDSRDIKLGGMASGVQATTPCPKHNKGLDTGPQPRPQSLWISLWNKNARRLEIGACV
jgi:hypothetical protein